MKAEIKNGTVTIEGNAIEIAEVIKACGLGMAVKATLSFAPNPQVTHSGNPFRYQNSMDNLWNALHGKGV